MRLKSSQFGPSMTAPISKPSSSYHAATTSGSSLSATHKMSEAMQDEEDDGEVVDVSYKSADIDGISIFKQVANYPIEATLIYPSGEGNDVYKRILIALLPPSACQNATPSVHLDGRGLDINMSWGPVFIKPKELLKRLKLGDEYKNGLASSLLASRKSQHIDDESPPRMTLSLRFPFEILRHGPNCIERNSATVPGTENPKGHTETIMTLVVTALEPEIVKTNTRMEFG